MHLDYELEPFSFSLLIAPFGLSASLLLGCQRKSKVLKVSLLNKTNCAKVSFRMKNINGGEGRGSVWGRFLGKACVENIV